MAYDHSVHAKALELTRLSIAMTTAAGSGHPTSAASLAHLTTVLMYDHMRWAPSDPANAASDRLVLSEGHAVPIIYAAGADLGIGIVKQGERTAMTRDDAMQLRAIDSPIDGHPHPVFGFPFFDAATGSLGQGLSVAAGLAVAARIDHLPRRAYCLIGDGEAREGQIWEAVDFIADQQLTAVCPIFNCNAFGQSDVVGEQQAPDAIAAKLEAVGFKVAMIDGHHPTEVKAALEGHAAATAKLTGTPYAIVARTVKGWGAESMHGQGLHGKPVEEGEQMDTVMAELDATARQLGAEWTDGDLNIPAIEFEAPALAEPTATPTFTEAMQQYGKPEALAKGKWATRRAYGVGLQALGHADPSIVALDGDVKNSTFAENFAKDKELAGRYVECRIAEQNMISVGAGISAAGRTPFLSTFAKFVTRAYDQVEMAINSGANLKMTGSHAGVSLAADGPSQMSLPDIAWFRAFTTVKHVTGGPAMYLLQPADAFCAYALTLAMAEHDGACYMRTLRPDTDFLYDDKTQFSLGGHEVLAEGKDLLIVAAGYMVHEALKAMDALKDKGVEATLVDLYSIPFDAAAIADLARDSGGNVLTLEDNYGAGYGGAIAEVLAEQGVHGTFRQMHVRRMPKSGRTPDEVMHYLGLHADDIAAAAVEIAGE